jgi:ribosomal protein S27AE
MFRPYGKERIVDCRLSIWRCSVLFLPEAGASKFDCSIIRLFDCSGIYDTVESIVPYCAYCGKSVFHAKHAEKIRGERKKIILCGFCDYYLRSLREIPFLNSVVAERAEKYSRIYNLFPSNPINE